jgi:hypothetical protein
MSKIFRSYNLKVTFQASIILKKYLRQEQILIAKDKTGIYKLYKECFTGQTERGFKGRYNERTLSVTIMKNQDTGITFETLCTHAASWKILPIFLILKKYHFYRAASRIVLYLLYRLLFTDVSTTIFTFVECLSCCVVYMCRLTYSHYHSSA